MTNKKDDWQKDPVMMTAFVLVMVGALNWGVLGLAEVNVVNWLLGSWPMVEKVVYMLVGLAGVYSVYSMAMKMK